MTDLSPAEVASLVGYDPETGHFHWLPRLPHLFADGNQTAERNCAAWNGKFAGRGAFKTMSSHGYLVGTIFNRPYFAHRVAWALSYGAWPKDQIDHLNRIKSDNRLVNLRAATNAQNQHNTAISVRNTSGFKGVSQIRGSRKFRATVEAHGVAYHLGRFDCAEDASAAYVAAARRLYGDFACSG